MIKKTIHQLVSRYNFIIEKFKYLKPMSGRGSLISRILYNLKLQIIGGQGLF